MAHDNDLFWRGAILRLWHLAPSYRLRLRHVLCLDRGDEEDMASLRPTRIPSSCLDPVNRTIPLADS
jgi:hypothetical protein